MHGPGSNAKDFPLVELPALADPQPSESTRPVQRIRPDATHILLIEDDADLRLAMTEYLEREGLIVTSATSQHQALEQMKRSDIGLVLLDLRLGSEDGFDILRELRRESDLPVIVVTGSRRDEVDRVLGLELGADDYMTKPFSLRELLARIKAVLRRFEAVRTHRDPAAHARRTCRFIDWTFDRRIRRLTDPTGRVVPLTKGEFALLSTFVDTPQRALTREFLLQATRIHEDIYDRSIDVQILRLRRKLELDPGAPRVIVTERGVGYKFAVTVDHVTSSSV